MRSVMEPPCALTLWLARSAHSFAIGLRALAAYNGAQRRAPRHDGGLALVAIHPLEQAK
jgi:hypothetical protein